MLLQAQRLQIAEDVVVTGFLPFAAVAEWYARAALFLFPSVRETQGMVMLEALAHGVPAVAVDSAVNAEVLQPAQAGCLTAPEPETMAAAVVQALAAPEKLREWAERGRSYAGRFTPASIAGQVEAVYASLRRSVV